ncbi:Do family serine endopeptidase [Sinorhizobium terangae]|uniref:Probable periplasmic serine endoprotease DegP-like n=1 Tax=Sinorhizobium terangae TaxID=110322 RepID=A0A6N7L8Q4_SINTE|nr:Do family serine endopeptidase [Sinorhizobium terangae]MBB4185570.1 serine protease Do [Sinorhizobium terangae]MQX13325.1 Do family serine endopeptidase [Sinorhizobium terangae]WFU46363.1 Do family serine endopeptidase [Sinorhizobium terangae]
MSTRPQLFRGLVLAAATALLLNNTALAETATSQPAAGPPSVADLAEGLLDAVVNISISQNVKSDDDDAPMPQVPEGSPHQEFFDEFFKGQGGEGNRPRTVNSLGSGFVIDSTGFIVTNNHVIQDADDIEINFSDGSKLKAKLVGMDTKTDLAVLKVEPKKPLKAVSFGDSRKIRIGDWVMVVGNPFGLGVSVSVGVVSARGRNINAGPYDSFIQTDAAINRGNSGGPLFNMRGEVIGINTAILSQTGMSVGIGFAVPTELAMNVVNQLKEFGETRRGWLGVRIQPVTDDIAESLKMERPHGALVSGIIEGGPIAKGEIKAGDIITRFDGTDVAEIRDLMRAVGESPVGKMVDVVIIRDGKEQTVRVTLGRLEDGEHLANVQTNENGEGAKPTEPPAAQLPATDAVLGMKLAVLDAGRRKSFGIAEDVKGVVVTEVQPNSAAAERRVAVGDVIVEVGQEAMDTPEDVSARIEELKGDGRRNALLMIANKTGELRFVTVQME